MNTAIYNVTPAQAEQMLGRPVGPNHLGEFFQAVDYEVVEKKTFQKDFPFGATVEKACRLIFAPMTEAAKTLVSEEHRQDLVALVNSNVRRFPNVMPEWHSSIWKMNSGLKIRMAERSKLTAPVPRS